MKSNRKTNNPSLSFWTTWSIQRVWLKMSSSLPLIGRVEVLRSQSLLRKESPWGRQTNGTNLRQTNKQTNKQTNTNKQAVSVFHNHKGVAESINLLTVATIQVHWSKIFERGQTGGCYWKLWKLESFYTISSFHFPATAQVLTTVEILSNPSFWLAGKDRRP